MITVSNAVTSITDAKTGEVAQNDLLPNHLSPHYSARHTDSSSARSGKLVGSGSPGTPAEGLEFFGFFGGLGSIGSGFTR